MASECAACQAARERRARVIPRGVTGGAKACARNGGCDKVAVLWRRPLFTPIMFRSGLRSCFEQESTRSRRNNVFAGVSLTSVLQLVEDTPVLLTDTINRGEKLYSGRRGRVVGWQLHPDSLKTYQDGECVLSHQPVEIFVKFPGATWHIKDLDAVDADITYLASEQCDEDPGKTDGLFSCT